MSATVRPFLSHLDHDDSGLARGSKVGTDPGIPKLAEQEEVRRVTGLPRISRWLAAVDRLRASEAAADGAAVLPPLAPELCEIMGEVYSALRYLELAERYWSGTHQMVAEPPEVSEASDEIVDLTAAVALSSPLEQRRAVR